MSDNYEMVERFAANMLAKSGDERLIPAMIASAIRNNTSERVEFSLKQAMPMFDGEKLIAEFERQFPEDQLHRLRNGAQADPPLHRSQCKALDRHDEVGSWTERTKKAACRTSVRCATTTCISWSPNCWITCAEATIRRFSRPCWRAFGWFTLSVRRDERSPERPLDASRDESLAPAVRSGR